MDAYGGSAANSSVPGTDAARLSLPARTLRTLLRWAPAVLYAAAGVLLLFNIAGIFPHSQTADYASRINADRARYAEGIISAVESLSYQFFVNHDLNALLFDYSLSSETYDVSKWNMPFSSFLEGMATTVPELEEAIFYDLHNDQKRPLTMTDSITKNIWNAARQMVSTAAEQADGRPVWTVVSLSAPGTTSASSTSPLLACARIVKFVPSGSRIGLLVLLLNPERLSRAVAGSYWEDRSSLPKSDLTVLIDDHGLIVSGIGAGLIGLPASALVPGFPKEGFDPEREQGRYYSTQSILGRPSRKYLVLYQLLPERRWWLCTVLPHAWENSSVLEYLSPLLLVLAGLAMQWSIRKRDLLSESRLEGTEHGMQRTPLTEAELQTLHDLTPRERAILSLLALGRSNKEIAAELGLREQTVKNYLYALYRKLGVQDRVGATRFAIRAGMASPAS